jgi:adenine-specific DNA-methyltransferase
MIPYYSHNGITIYNADAQDLLRSLPDASVDLIATDPPYFRVKDEAWDRAWKSESAFLEWIGELCEEWRRILKANGSLYVFASPDMVYGVRAEIAGRFNVLNEITWRKEYSRANQAEKEALRAFFPSSEKIVFADHFGSDETADGEVGYTAECESAKRAVFGDYLRAEFQRAGLNNREVAEITKCYGKVNHGGSVSNWLLGYNCPTTEQYQRLRDALGLGYLEMDYSTLRYRYEELQREMEELKEQYRSLRRPFLATPSRPFTDVWDFPPVPSYAGRHTCEKPLAMMEHIVLTSSRPGALVLDCFAGSGTTLEAARNNGRRAIGCDSSLHWCRRASERLSQEVLPFDQVA